MLLGCVAIQEWLNKGYVVCSPAPKKIEAVHIDLHIGGAYWTPRKGITRVNIRDTKPEDYYELVEAPADGVIVVPPNSMILAHTVEFAGTSVDWLNSDIDTRSTPARCGVTAHVTAGHGDPGFGFRWTLEVANLHPFEKEIPVGARFCSIRFQTVQQNNQLYVQRYNGTEDDWNPYMMLPRINNV